MTKLDVIAQLRVMPKDIDIDLDGLMGRIMDSLPDNTKIEAYRREPIAFGLEALVINVLMEDKAGGTSPVEEAIQKQEGVETIEVVGVTRI
jgi:elongation factor 1-beta